jgi:hypothetical protein
VREAQVEGAPVQRFGRVGEGVGEEEEEECEPGFMGGGLAFEGDGKEDIVLPLWWSCVGGCEEDWRLEVFRGGDKAELG